MRRYSHPMHFLALAGVMMVCPHPLQSNNAKLSTWIQNVSEMFPSEVTGANDYNCELAVSGSTVHVMWLADEGSPATRVVYYRRSADGGKTWEARKRLFAAGDIVTDATYKRMAVDGNNVHIAVSNYGNKPGGTWYGILTYIRSGDGGANFDGPVSLFSADQAWHVYDIHVASDQGKTSIGFRHQCNWCVNNTYVLMNSLDGGKSFKQQTAYSTTTGRGWNVLDVKRSGDNIYVLYTDSYFYYGLQYSDLYLAASSDGGANFKSQKISIPSKNNNHKTGSLQDQNCVPKIATYNREVYVVWDALDEDDQRNIIFRKSADNGVTFSAAVNLTKGATLSGADFQQGQETIAAINGKVYVIYLRNDASVYMVRSMDDGVSFQSPQKLTSSGYMTDGGWWPVVSLDPTDSTGSKVYVFWKAPQYVVSTDSGATFTKPMMLSNQFSWKGNDPSRPRFVIAPDAAIHWAAEGNMTSWANFGDSDIFYRRVDPAPPPAASRMSLRLSSFRNRLDNTGMERYDNMSVPASADLNFTSAMTAEMWVKPYADGATTGSSDVTKPILSKRETIIRSSYEIGTTGGDPNNRQPYAHITTRVNATTTQDAWVGLPVRMGIVADGTWTHLAFTYDANSPKNNFLLYINGKLAGTATASGNIASGDGTLFAGYYGNWELQELRFWNRALNASEILADSQKVLTGKEAGLVAYYNFANTTRDMTGRGNNGTFMYQESFVANTLTLPPPVFVSAVKHAASYNDTLAPESIVTLFGSGLADSEAGASTVPLPTSLAGASVNVRDVNGRDRAAPLFYAGPGQINFAVPVGTYASNVEITVNNSAGQDRMWTQVSRVAPGIFSANGSGKGTAAGSAVIVAADGTQSFQNLFAADLSPAPIDLGGPNDQVYLVLYGTGLRGFSAKPTATVGGTAVPVTVAAQGTFVGLDQVNIGPVPASLRGSGVVDIVISGDGQQSNPVNVAFE